MIVDILIVLAVLGILGLIAWSFLDILRSDFPGVEKPIWLALVWLAPFFGALLYLEIGRKRKIERRDPPA